MDIKIGNLYTLQSTQRPELNGKVVDVFMVEEGMYFFTCMGLVLKTCKKDILKPVEVVND